MAEPSARLSLADQVMVNAVIFLAVAPSGDDNLGMAGDILRDVLVHVDEDHEFIGNLADAAHGLLTADDPAAQLRVKRHLARFAF